MRVWWVALVVGAACARELDPAACGARFDVQRDKIIRTEESRDMGARYLSELDVGARHECLRLCCETDACDVFVYEEKSPGSCYLFKCGPPEDFRCKFTAHGNFSSGVLALSRRLAELQDQERLAHNDRHLAALRAAAATTTTTTPPPRAPDPPPGRCSRYQFECRRGGECIAVYNACDGVPQCADGSDEAPELGCPAPPALAPPPAPAPAVPPAPAPPTPATTPPPTPTLPPPPPPPPSLPLKPLQMSGEADPVESDLEAEPDRWPHRLTQAQPPRTYNEVSRGPHIFSHKGGLLQEAAPPQYAPFEPPWTRRLWNQQTGGEWGGAWAEPDPRRAWPVPQPPDPEVAMYMPAKPMPEVVAAAYPGPPRDGPKKGLRAPPPPPPPPPPSPTAPATPATPATPAPAPTVDNHTKKKVLHETMLARAPAAALAADEHDGLSEHPPAAVLLLVLGVGMTGVVGALAGCRARAARRRLRRGKAALAHDADYLVNGMYL